MFFLMIGTSRVCTLNSADDTVIKFMTDGVLLKEVEKVCCSCDAHVMLM